jgi:hypothetical protein
MLSIRAARLVSPRHLILAAITLSAFALPLATARAADSPVPGIRIFNGESPNLALVTSAKCKVDRTGFTAVGYQNSYILYVRIRHFTGFHKYALRRGVFTGTWIEVRNPALVWFASDYVPPYPVPGGGEINFADHGMRLGGGFYPMFNQTGTDGVGTAGGLKCRYPKKRARR